MLVTLIPIFDKDMRVRAYSLFTQKRNHLLEPALLGVGCYDGAANVEGLEVIQNIGIDTLSPGTDVFVPVGNIAVFSDIESQCDNMGGRLTFLFDNTISNEEMYLKRLRELKAAGYKLAIRKIPVNMFEKNKDILDLMDYIFLDCKKVDVKKAKIYFGHLHPNIQICVGNIDDQETFEEVRADEKFALFEGAFYRVPVTKGEVEVTPLKANYLELLNMVNDADFDLTKAADVISRDTAMVLSLLEMVNKMTVNSKITSIRHAAAMLGQKELKKWINTAVTRELCADRPNEITRISLLRAKFMEQLAPMYGMAQKSSELFLTGLFSVLDLILNMPMEEALKKVNVSKEIIDALVSQKGDLAPVYHLMLCYENADWQEISRQMIMMNQSINELADIYISSLTWYKDLFFSGNV